MHRVLGLWLVLGVWYTYVYTCGVLAFTLNGVREIKRGRRILFDLSMERHSSNLGARSFHKNVETMPRKVRKKDKGKFKVKYT